MNSNKIIDNIKKFFKRIGWTGFVIIIVAFSIGYFGAGSRKVQDSEAKAHAHADTNQTEIWTCSMHPQIKLDEPGQCPICFMDLVPLESTGSGVSLSQLKLSQRAMELAEIQTSKVQRRPAIREISLSGKVTYDETRLKKISSWIPGRIEKLYINYTGMRVEKGDKLFEIYSPELIAAQEELIQIKKTLQKYEDQSRSSYQKTQLTLEKTREKLRLLGLNSDQINQIENKLTPSQTITIHSPTSGIVTDRKAIQGRYVNTGTIVYKVADLSQVWVNLDAYESDLQWLEKGQKVDIRVAAYPGHEFSGQISFIDPVLNSNTRSVKIRVAVENSDLILKPGMFARAMVKAGLTEQGQVIAENHFDHNKKLESSKSPLVVPASAVLLTGKRAIAYVRLPEKKEPVFEFREVELGPKAGQYYIVKSGLKAGEKVVTRGNFKIDSAMEIAAKPSMMNPDAGDSEKKNHEHSGHDMSSSMNTAEMDSKEQSEIQLIKINDSGFIKTLNKIYDHYFASQKALAQDNSQAAINSFQKIHSIINQTSGSNFKISENGLEKWEELSSKLMQSTHNLETLESIEKIRETFETISMTVLDLEKTFGHAGDRNFYQIYCPMAFDNKGASWIQTDSSVKNPYFGSSMLKCGEVQETYQPYNSEKKEAHNHE
ncbi:MAG TPA: efflux RND transporter periplasmic adaptor subunit [bacterium]|nr:efflux RND transporter periplasmic adaptor subunit [bacterium]